MNLNIGLIGAGNMGSALVNGIVKSGAVSADRVNIYDVQKGKTDLLKKSLGVNTFTSAIEVIEKSDVIIIAVKPNIVKSVLEDCKSAIDNKKIIISIAVGIPINFFKGIIGDDKKIVRAMPNTPALVGEGMTVISCGSNITEEEKGSIKEILNCVGKVEELEEKLMSEVTALTGSSPAYIFMLIEAMCDAAVRSGIPRAITYRLAAQAVLGSAKMVLETGIHPGELKDQVCSPAGTTIEAVCMLEKNGFRYAVAEAMDECTKRARELGKIYG